MARGTCLCGRVRYEVTAPFDTMVHCHCSMCRKHHGAMFATFVSAPADSFRWLAGEDALGRYNSSEHGVRSFCRHCGSVAPAILSELGAAICPAGNLEDDPGIRPQMHMFAGSKASSYTITDALPQHEGYPPEFGGGLGVERPSATARPNVSEGSCLCGEVAYELRGTPLRIMNCHCSRCRRGRSAAHATNMFAKLDDFRWLQGESSTAEYKVPEAKMFTLAFCTRCGAEVPRISRERGAAVVPVGALDTDPGIQPEAHIFVGSKAPWFEITDSLPQFAEYPAT